MSVDAAATGDEVTFTVSVKNLGPQSTAKVEVTDKLDECLEFVSSTTDRGSYDPGTGVWRGPYLDRTDESAWLRDPRGAVIDYAGGGAQATVRVVG